MDDEQNGLGRFKPLESIGPQTRATLWEKVNTRLLAELLDADPAGFQALMKTYRDAKVPDVRAIEKHATKTLKEAKARARKKKVPKDDFVRDDDTGRILLNQHNIKLAIEKLGVELRYDEFKGFPVVSGLPDFGPLLDDPALNRLFFEIDDKFDFRPADPYFQRFIADVSRRNSFHPVVDYLDRLTWDSVPRLDTWLTTYANVKDTPLARACGAIVLIAAVRRVRTPGTKFDEMLVLEGVEGLAKSTLLSILAVDADWFSDLLPLNADDKMMIESTGGKWIVEVPELQGMSKADSLRVKAQLSRQTDRARLAYGRLPTEVKRQFVIIGTTNGENYLASLTGNRRFWPFRVGNYIDLKAFERDRDQLWAEASIREAAGESIRLPESLWVAARREVEKRELDNPMYDKLLAVIGDQQGVISYEEAWKIVGTNRLPADYEKLKKAFKKLGFQPKKTTIDGIRQSAFVRGEYRSGQKVPRICEDGSEANAEYLTETE